MSLINEALKKAQRQRGGDSVKDAPGVYETPSGRIERRGSTPRAQLILLLAAGAVVLMVLSAVVAVFIVNRSPDAPKPPLVAAKTVPAVDLNAPSPTIVAPAITPPPSVVATKSEPEATPDTNTVLADSTPSEPVAAPVAIPPVSRAPQADPKIWTFVDAIRVTGIRSSGGVSKVLMNDRVYRVNDYVERTLGVKLAKVEEDKLTFVDENGFEYTKTF